MKKQELRAVLSTIGAPPDAEEKILSHIALVLKWGRSMNLTGATTETELLSEHVADALPLASLLKEGRLLDVGSGAGFPGVVVAIIRPEIEVTMLENNHKKAVFLRTALREANRKGRALDGDIFQPTAELGAPFSAVVSRAVFAPTDWIKIGAPLVSPGGVLYALLGKEAAPLAPSGFSEVQTHEYSLASGAKRTIAAYRR